MQDLLRDELARVPGYLDHITPRRIVTRSGTRKRGILTTPRHGQLHWESPIERVLLKALTLSPCVTELVSQPAVFQIALPNGDVSRYTPDVAAKLNGRVVVFEAKDHAQAHHPLLTARLQAIHALFREASVHYRVVTERDCSESYERRLDELWAHRWYRGQRDIRELRAAARRIAEQRPTLTEFIAYLGDRHAALHVLAAGQVHVDLARPVNGDSVIYPISTENWDAIQCIVRTR